MSVCTGLTQRAPSETRSKRKICSATCGLCLLLYLFRGEALHCTLQAGIVERQLAKRVAAHDRSVVWHLQVADHVGRLQVSGPRMCKRTQSPEQHNTGKLIQVHAVNLKCTLSAEPSKKKSARGLEAAHSWSTGIGHSAQFEFLSNFCIA